MTSRDYDPETDQFPPTTDAPSDVERPGSEGADDPIPVPPTEEPPSPIQEPPESPNVPDERDPEPIGDPATNEPTQIV
jgi:hypothetical protein